MSRSTVELHILGPTELRGTDIRTVKHDRPDMGGDVVDHAGQTLSPKRLALLAYLAVDTSDGFRRRDHIVGIFWPELSQEAARAQLRKSLSVLREQFGADAIATRGEGEVRLNRARVWCDAVAMEALMAERRWNEALSLYRGDLLEGLFPAGVAQEFHKWLADARNRLRQHAARAAWECSAAEAQGGDRVAAAVMARRALAYSPDDEDGVRRLMSLLDRNGDRAGALRLYAEWQEHLQDEYAVEPAPETRKLARRVQAARKGESHETPPTQAAIQSVAPVSAEANAVTAASRPRRLSLWPTGAAAMVGAAALISIAALSRGTARAAVSPRSILILPLRIIGDAHVATVAAGMTEELTTALARDTGFIVRSVERSGEDVDRLGRRARVAFIVDGGVQGDAARRRVTLRLVRAIDGVTVWAESYDLNAGSLSPDAERIAAATADIIRRRVRNQESTTTKDRR
jgi:DNA-binding SARP family transcriptional activator/TolB-like protein